MTPARLKELRELEEHSHWDVDVTVVHAALPELLDEVERLRAALTNVVRYSDLSSPGVVIRAIEEARAALEGKP